MRFASVRCHPFGPFRDDTLSLRPGMNVVFGPNEAGKSTWSAALAAGLCGIRRGPGARREDREFTRRHRPWDGGEKWRLTTVVELADGRRIELAQDLGRRFGSAREVDPGRDDLSSEIRNEGTPDGSRWLGLDRLSFRRVACLRQGELLSLLEDADSLQADLHRAAATARTESTATEAIERLDQYRQERVGTDRAPTKPLRRSRARVEAARAELASAKARRAEFEDRRRNLTQLEGEVLREEVRVEAAIASMAETEAREAQRRFDAAKRLSDRFPEGPPRPSARRNELADRIAAGLARWKNLPDPAPPAGPEAPVLEAQIAAWEARRKAGLAVRSEGEAVRARERLSRARRLAALFPDGPPRNSAAHQEETSRITAGLARWEALPDLQPPAGPEASALEAQIAAWEAKERAGLAVRADRQAVLADQRYSQAQRLAALFPDGRPRAPAEDADLAAQVRSAISAWEAMPPLRPPTGPSASELEAELGAADREHARLSSARAGIEVLRAIRGARIAALLGAAAACALLGVAFSGIGWAGLLALLGGCGWWFARRLPAQRAATRRRLDDLTTRRRSLERSISKRELDDRAHAEASRRRRESGERIVGTAAQAGIEVTDPEAAVGRLRRWLAARSDEQREYGERIGRWDELQRELAGATLGAIASQAAELRERAQELRAATTRGELQAAREQNLLSDAKWEQFERSAEAARSELRTRLGTRRAQDQAHAERREQRAGTVRELVALARSVGAEANGAETAIAALEGWRRRQGEEQATFDERSRQWDELQQELAGETLEDIANRAAELEERARELRSATTSNALQAAREEGLGDAEWAEFEHSAAAALGDLRMRLGTRREQDQACARRQAEREAVGRELVALARSVEPETSGAEAAIAALADWRQRRREDQARFEERSQRWDELQALLGGESLGDLSRRHEELAAKARDRARKVDEAAKARFRGIRPEKIEEMRRELNDRRQALEKSRGQAEEFEKTLPDLVTLEEALTAAKAEEKRVLDLDSILRKTTTFLATARDRIHRDLAPVLRKGVLPWLQKVTGERYADCRVDPRTLAVEVRGPDRSWRPAADLSQGTTEQIYLLLRLALTRHLGNPDEPCPLILDDPLATSDAARRRVLLETLLAVSEERQVILFTHEEDQRRWAAERLTARRHHLEQLGGDRLPA